MAARTIILDHTDTIFLPVGADHLLRWVVRPSDMDAAEALSLLASNDPRVRDHGVGMANIARVVASHEVSDGAVELYLDGGITIVVHAHLRDAFRAALEGRTPIPSWKD